MNIELINEIKELRELKLSDSDISKSIGISNQNILLIMRIDKVVRQDLKIDTLDESITIIQKDLDNKNLEILNLKSELNDLKSNDLFLKFEELKEEFDILKKENSDLEDNYMNLEMSINSLPNYIRTMFLKK